MKKKLLVASAIALVGVSCLTFAGCFGSSYKEKDFLCDEGLSITLDESFSEMQAAFTYTLSSNNVVFMAQKEGFDAFESAGYDPYAMTLQEYAEMCVENNNLQGPVLEDEERGLVTFSYVKNVSGDNFYYYATVHKSGDAFWLCQFSCFEEKQLTYATQMADWASTILVFSALA